MGSVSILLSLTEGIQQRRGVPLQAECFHGCALRRQQHFVSQQTQTVAQCLLRRNTRKLRHVVALGKVSEHDVAGTSVIIACQKTQPRRCWKGVPRAKAHAA